MSTQLPAIPSAADLPEQGETLPPGDAFVLLSKPTLELTFDDIKRIASDLRAKRVAFLKGKQDNPGKKAAPVLTEEEKQARGQYVAGLLGNIKL